MTDEIETALFALADLIQWEFESADGFTQWSGKGARVDYGIYCPSLQPSVDASPERHFVLLYLSSDEDLPFNRAYVPTVAEARRLCVNHLLSGDFSEIEAVHAAAEARNQAFKGQRLTAQIMLCDAIKAHKAPHLKWRSVPRTTLQWAAKGKRGSYQVCFTPEERWTVTVAPAEGSTEPQRFLTLDIAQQACRIHSHTGNWFGTLKREGFK